MRHLPGESEGHQHSRPLGRSLKPVPSEYNADMLTIRPRRSVRIVLKQEQAFVVTINRSCLKSNYISGLFAAGWNFVQIPASSSWKPVRTAVLRLRQSETGLHETVVPCRKILRHVKDLMKSHGDGWTKFSFPSPILLLAPEMPLLTGPPDRTGGCQSALVDKLGVSPVDIIIPWSTSQSSGDKK
jgi:hypothetical protein